MEGSSGKVVNTHWYGSQDKLPLNTVYIGRPSEWGNSYSLDSGKYTREEVIALHRVDLYHSLKSNPLLLAKIIHDLKDHDLACWCVHPKKVIGCHGNTFIHILSDRIISRLYDKTVVHYLMDDLRLVLADLEQWILKEARVNDYLPLYIHYNDVRLNINYVLLLCREKYVGPHDLEVFIATIVTELELALKEKTLVMMDYRFYHISWVIDRFIENRTDRSREPIPPDLPIKRPSKSKALPKEIST